MNTRVSKIVDIGGVQRTITGLYESDTYFQELGPGTAADLAEICQKYLPRNARCWDIGANIGVTAQIIAGICDQAKIVAVEPGLNNFECLLINIEQNGTSDRITPINAAVGAEDGQVNFMDASAYGYIVPEGTPTRLISPFTLYRETKETPVDFLKIDIEGFELPFLRAGMDIFRRNKTKIYMEFNGWCMFMNADINPKDCFSFIIENFPYTYLMNQHGVGMKRFKAADSYDILHEIIVSSSTVRDMLLSFDPLDG